MNTYMYYCALTSKRPTFTYVNARKNYLYKFILYIYATRKFAVFLKHAA
jgi:hypothetical protein